MDFSTYSLIIISVISYEIFKLFFKVRYKSGINGEIAAKVK